MYVCLVDDDDMIAVAEELNFKSDLLLISVMHMLRKEEALMNFLPACPSIHPFSIGIYGGRRSNPSQAHAFTLLTNT